ALLGYTPDEVNARGGPEITYADANTAREVYETLITRGTWHRDVALRSAAGHILIADLRADRILDEQGTQAGLIGVFSDVTERRRAERALHELEQRLIQHVENSPLAVIEWNADLQVRRWSIRATQIFGWDETAVVGRRLDEWPASAPDNQVAIHAMLQPLLTSQPHRNVSVILVHNQRGEQLYCEWYNSALFDDEGNFVSILSLVHDMTDRQRLQEQFLQSQKMEIVGRLAGGIAHDFNNLLTVILSYSELAHEMAEPESSIADDLAEVRRAAERAADLTSRLLTFARKQIIAPRPLDLNLLLLDLDRLLRRLIGEDIELILLMYTDTANVLADAGQIEQAVINLVVNARDAMPQGGRLVIETSLIELHAEYREASLAVAPGWYVQLAVSDTGTGMDEATRSRIFEPFFTTKVSGKGTGLGLATCYGIVRQHNGHITAYSEPGEGTTFRIYLPLYQPDTAEPLPIATMATLPRGSETILLVEDDAQLRGLALRILRDQGYRVIEAHDGREALRIAHEATHPIDLLLTDIILPHVSGTELAFQLQSVHPAMRVLYTSGYTEYTALHNGRIDAGMAFVAKPFTPMVLTAMVRRVLDE
ncbi:MAG TPA: PAS domain S-box protein, partial [Roseiflexaceae bacterium]|nr:PAS domain S-box protein [Roseiflexaceae bacterium]